MNKDIIIIFNESFIKTFNVKHEISEGTVEFIVKDNPIKEISIKIPTWLLNYREKSLLYKIINNSTNTNYSKEMVKFVNDCKFNANLNNIVNFLNIKKIDNEYNLIDFYEKYIFFEKFRNYISKLLSINVNNYVDLPKSTQKAINDYIIEIVNEKYNIKNINEKEKEKIQKYNENITPLIINILNTIIKELDLKYFNEK